MFRILSFGIVALLSLTIASSCLAAQILLDLGFEDQETNLTNWNNYSGSGSGSLAAGPFSLNYTSGSDSGIDIGFANSSTGLVGYSSTAANYDGTYPAAVSGYPDSANRDGLFNVSGASITATLSNLNPAGTYDFFFYGAAGNSGGSTTWTVTGMNSDSDTIPVTLNNSTDVALVDNIIPDGSNEITIFMDASNPGRWNVLRITEHLPFVAPVPEPATGLILGFGAVLLLGTRSKRRRAAAFTAAITSATARNA